MHPIWFFVAFLALIYATLWFYFKPTVWCKSQTCLVGKTAVITGANTGIGFQTALDLAKRGARVIIACRDRVKGEKAKSEIIRETGNTNIVVKIVDLASFKSVRNFAEEINETEQRLDILVNNAGVAGVGNVKTEDGLEWLMQVNHFSSFLLTNLLIDLLKKSAPSRIVNVSSRAAKRAKFDINNLNNFTGYVNDYACSKVCNILFTKELAKRLEGTGVTTYSLHPGTVKTEIFRHLQGRSKLLVEFLSMNFFKTAEEGAQTIIYLAVTEHPEDFSGCHFDNCQIVESYEIVRDPTLPPKLWQISEKFVGLKAHEKTLFLSTKNILITGANEGIHTKIKDFRKVSLLGIGFHSALTLASLNHKIIMADKSNLTQAKNQIIDATCNQNIVTKSVDFTSLTSIRHFAEGIKEEEKRLDVLINNVGVFCLGKDRTVDGLQATMQVNHFGPFLLTHLLSELLVKSAPSRILFASSLGSFFHKLTIDNINNPDLSCSDGLSSLLIYYNSKLCNLITANGFSRRLKKDKVWVNSYHPGMTGTSFLWKNKFVPNPFSKFLQNPGMGAQSSVFLATSKNVEGISGKFFVDLKEHQQPRITEDEEFCKAVWEATEYFVDLKKEECFC